MRDGWIDHRVAGFRIDFLYAPIRHRKPRLASREDIDDVRWMRVHCDLVAFFSGVVDDAHLGIFLEDLAMRGIDFTRLQLNSLNN